MNNAIKEIKFTPGDDLNNHGWKLTDHQKRKAKRKAEHGVGNIF